MTLRFFSSTFAVGTFLVVFFVQPLAYVGAKTTFFSHFAPNGVQNDDSNVSSDRGVESDSAIDASPANASVFNDSNARANSADEADSNADASPWLKLERSERGVPRRLLTSIVRFEGDFRAADGQTRPVSVDLIGAIHLGEQAYYDRLNDEFKEYETVVFELVANANFDVKDLAAEKNKKNEKKEGPASPLDAIPFLQESLADALGFVNQTDGIDYLAPNLKRGDANVDDFLARFATGGDVPNYFLGSAFDSLLSSDSGRVEGWALACLLTKDRRLALRRFFADELSRTELSAEPGERETALIHFRNEIAINVARQELEAGKTKIAVFYGAAHLDDLARRVEKTLVDPRRSAPRWLVAWSMEPAAQK